MTSLFIEGLLLGALIAISVGPAFFAIIQTGINKGFKYGVYMAAGISLSDIVMVIISFAIGAALFNDAQSKIYVGIIGGIILIIFGSVSWAKKPEIMKRRHINLENPPKDPQPIGYVLRGFILNIMNPFLFFFWFGALGFVGKNSEKGNLLENSIVFFSATFLTIFVTDVLKSFIGIKIKRYFSPRRELVLNKVVGIALVLFGIVLIFKTLEDFGFMNYMRMLRID
jgi:threonine/homoserine/homoserine lactone efflux protein